MNVSESGKLVQHSEIIQPGNYLSPATPPRVPLFWRDLVVPLGVRRDGRIIFVVGEPVGLGTEFKVVVPRDGAFKWWSGPTAFAFACAPWFEDVDSAIFMLQAVYGAQDER